MTNSGEGGEQWVLFISSSARLSTASCNILINKLMKYRLGKRTVRWTEIILNCQAFKGLWLVAQSPAGGL